MAALEGLQNLVRERGVEVGRDPDLPSIRSRRARATDAGDWNQASDRPSSLGDDDFLSRRDAVQDPREVRLGLVDVHDHDDASMDLVLDLVNLIMP